MARAAQVSRRARMEYRTNSLRRAFGIGGGAQVSRRYGDQVGEIGRNTTRAPAPGNAASRPTLVASSTRTAKAVLATSGAPHQPQQRRRCRGILRVEAEDSPRAQKRPVEQATGTLVPAEPRLQVRLGYKTPAQVKLPMA